MVEYIVKETGYPGRLETENVGELIRCKDCKYYTIERGWNGIEFTVCSISLIHHHPIRRENDYCSRAERKEGADG